MPYLRIALGGALGSVARFALNGVVSVRMEENFPWGDDWCECGGLTTFSSSILPTLNLCEMASGFTPAAMSVGGGFLPGGHLTGLPSGRGAVGAERTMRC